MYADLCIYICDILACWRVRLWSYATMCQLLTGVGSNGEHLVIHNVTRMCADVYICIADNNVPPATKQEFIVDVHCKSDT